MIKAFLPINKYIQQKLNKTIPIYQFSQRINQDQQFLNNSRDTFEMFVKMYKQDIAKKAPWVALLSTDTKWQEMQSQVDCAALLTNQCSPGGWYIQPANLNSEIIQEKCEQIIGSYQSDADDIDTLMQEFFYKVLIQDEVYYSSVQQSALQVVNEFVKSRNPQFQQGWSENELVLILNNNLKIIRKSKFNIEELPKLENLSIEVIYGLMLSYYGQKLIQDVPQIAVLAVVLPFVNGLQDIKQSELIDLNPLERKRVKLLEKYQKMKNWQDKVDINDKMDIYQIVDTFKKAVSEKTAGRSTRNKFKKLIKYISDENFKRSKAYKDKCFKVRKDIKQLHLKNDIENDYRQYKPMEKLFFMGLTQALNKLPTDICVYNNGTLRNPRLHIVYPFLTQQYPDLDKNDRAKGEKLVKELEYIAQLIKKAKQYGYFVSDWQNHIARQWGVLRNQIIQVNRELLSKNCQSVQVPPPVQFDIAIDLYPYAHPFAFTYGRVQGYGFKKEYDNCLQCFIEYYNNSEIYYFQNLLRNIPQKLDFLSFIPQNIRYIQDKKQLFTQLDDYLNNLYVSGQNNILIQVIYKYINKRKNLLPIYLKRKIQINDIQFISSMALFNAVFDLYPAEEVFLDKVQLDLPQQQSQHKQEIPEGYGGQNEGKYQYQWGPVNYGGYSQVRYQYYYEY